MKINEVIQTKRKALNMTQMQLAEKLDISDKTVSRWELGTIYPNVDMIPKIAAVLGITINELFGDNGNVSEPINNQEKRDLRQIVSFKIFLYILLSFSIISILILCFCNKYYINIKVFLILIASAFVLFILASAAFYIRRALYAAFYKEKFHINEYKKFDANITTKANFINTFMVSAFLLFFPRLIIGSIIIFAVTFLLNLNFMRRLGFYYKKFSLIIILLVAMIYIGFLCYIKYLVDSDFFGIGIYPNTENQERLFMPLLFLNFVMNLLTCFALLFFKRKR